MQNNERIEIMEDTNYMLRKGCVTEGICWQRFFAYVVCVCCFCWLHAQSSPAPSKEAKKEAKSLMKEGWAPMQNGEPMEVQMERCYQLQSMLVDDGEGHPEPRYLIATAESKDKNAEIAQTKVRTLCEAQMAQSLQAVITSLIEHEVKTRQLSATEAQTEDEVKQRTEMMSKASLRQCKVVRHFIRKNADGSMSVQMTLALDKTKLKP